MWRVNETLPIKIKGGRANCDLLSGRFLDAMIHKVCAVGSVQPHQNIFNGVLKYAPYFISACLFITIIIISSSCIVCLNTTTETERLYSDINGKPADLKALSCFSRRSSKQVGKKEDGFTSSEHPCHLF